MGISLRRATAADCDRLVSFYREFHAARARLTDPAIWRWQFLEQPHAAGIVPFFILEDGGQICGGIGYLCVKIRTGERVVDGLVPVNYFINPAYRGLPALRLFRAVLQESPVTIGTYVSQDALGLLNKSGFEDLSSEVHVYYYPLRAAANGSLASRLKATLRSAWEAVRAVGLRISQPGLAYRVSTELDHAFVRDPGWWPGLQCLQKSSEWLDWRYRKSPLLRARFVYQTRRGEPCGLAVIHVDAAKDTLVILDLLVHSADDGPIYGLVDEILAVARREKCALVVCHAVSTRLRRIFRNCLFGSRQSDVNLLVLCREAGLSGALADPGRWTFQLGDSDVY